jgi:GNAT superfamily N-acetyltransferase
VIRSAVAADVPQLLALMRKLAAFEGYLDRFAVTESDLLERGFNDESRLAMSSRHGQHFQHPRRSEFIAWVADLDGLQAYALAYSIPFTFDLRPTVVLKELFVDEAARGREFGSELFQAVIRYAHSVDARLIRWQVLPGNDAAKRFYRRVGGEQDTAWENWVLDL